jgi:hypothetical protein
MSKSCLLKFAILILIIGSGCRSAKKGAATELIGLNEALVSLGNRGGITMIIADDVIGSVERSALEGDPRPAVERIVAMKGLYAVERDGVLYVMKQRRPGW